MGYRCGLDGEMARLLNLKSGPPALFCDGCGDERSVQRPNGLPYRWFQDGRKAPGWTLGSDADGRRLDFCPGCKPSGAAKEG